MKQNGVRSPLLRLPEMSSLIRAVLLYDFVEPSLETNTVDWDNELPSIVDQRLAGVAHRMLAELDIHPPKRFLSQLNDAVFDWTTTSHIASSRAVADLEALSELDVDFVVTKGPGIACYAERLAERPYSDIDIFVSLDRFDLVQNLLAASGYREETKNIVPWPGLGAVCREAVNLRTSAGGSLDVHHRIPPWIWGSHITFSDVLDRSHVQAFPGGSLRCASAEDNLLISALHIVSDKNQPGKTLMAWRDLLVLARVAEPQKVVMMAKEASLCGWLKWVMAALPPRSISPQLMQALSGQDNWIPDSRRLTMMMSPTLAPRSFVLSQALRLPAGNALRYIAGLAWPSEDFLRLKLGDSRHSRVLWWRHVLSR